MKNQQLNQALAVLDPFVFLRDFSLEEELAKLKEGLPTLEADEAEGLLNLIKLTKDSEQKFFIGPITHPFAEHHEFANVLTIELSDKCYRLQEWIDYLGKNFPELGSDIAGRVIDKYVYLRRLR